MELHVKNNKFDSPIRGEDEEYNPLGGEAWVNRIEEWEPQEYDPVDYEGYRAAFASADVPGWAEYQMNAMKNAAMPPIPHLDVQTPPHYTHGEREAIDYMRDIGVLEPYCVGNIFKYLYRYKHKENPIKDLQKASTYINILVRELESRGKG